jgi:hypothetical protein
MNRIGIAIIVFVVWTAGAFFAGMEWRDRSCDLAVSEGNTKQAEAKVEAVVDARTEDKAGQASAAQVEQDRVAVEADAESQFKVIEVEVVRYVQANPDPAGCDLGPDGLRAWRAANAGRSDHAEPEHPGPANGAGTEGPSAAGRR